MTKFAGLFWLECFSLLILSFAISLILPDTIRACSPILQDCQSGYHCNSNGVCVTVCGPEDCAPPYVCTGQGCGLPGGGGGCFPAGTKVSLPDNQKKDIEDVKVGDIVASWSDSAKKIVDSVVTDTQQPISSSLCTVKYTNGETLEVTNSHPLKTQLGWKAIDPTAARLEDPGVPVSKLLVGDIEQTENGMGLTVSGISCKSGTFQVYNFTVADNHQYFVGTSGGSDILAHNKCTCGGCYSPGDCVGNQYGVTSTSASRTSSTTALIYWTTNNDRGNCGKYNGQVIILVGTDKSVIDNNCGIGSASEVYAAATASGGCDYGGTCVSHDSGETATFSPPAGCNFVRNTDSANISYSMTGLAPNSIYYIRAIGAMASGYNSKKHRWAVTFNKTCGGATGGYVSSCSANPSSASLSLGDTMTLGTTINASPYIDRVDYSGNHPIHLSFNPTSDSTNPYSTLVTALAQTYPSSTPANADIYLTSAPSTSACTATSNITVTAPATADAWWQVKDSDVATNGDLNSTIPTGQYFDDLGNGGYPGIPAYESSSNITGTNVSLAGWLAQSPIASPKVFDYHYFSNLAPTTNITTISNSSVDGSLFESGGTPDSDGYYWYEYDGSSTGLDLSINTQVNLGDRKVILLIKSANLYINGGINLTDGQGFFMTAVNGSIYVDPSVGDQSPDLEGIYEADGGFYTGVSDLQLHIRGSVAAYGGVDMQRDIGGAPSLTSPSELYEYAPDQIMLFPKSLGYRRVNWQEVAP